MTFTSFEFLLFFFIVAGIYYVLPTKVQYLWLLAASYWFYVRISAKFALILILVTAISYFLGRNIAGNRKKLILGIVLMVGILGYFKYLGWITESIAAFAGFLGLSADSMILQIVLPTGMSFYIFEALSYLIDGYRGKKTSCSFLQYALFLAFFPTVQSGPIERAEHLIPQLTKGSRFQYDNMRQGLLMILWGCFMKMIMADRLSMIVGTVFDHPESFAGTMVFLGTLAYTLEIYCDFAAYSNIAIGVGRVLGMQITENFKSPYLSGSIAEFWRRWHISLSSWLRDYVYIPLGGNRKGQFRKLLNILIVFAISGLWHGAAWTFVVWGILHGLYQVAGTLMKPVRDGLVEMLHVDRSSFSHRVLKICVTFLLVNFAWIFFRAGSFQTAAAIIRNMMHVSIGGLAGDSLLKLGLDQANLTLLIVSLIVMIIKDICNYNGIGLRSKLCAQGVWLRWIVYIGLALLVLTCGIWGPGYNADSFIYSQF